MPLLNHLQVNMAHYPTRQARYVSRDTVAHSHSVYTCSASVRASYHLTRRENIYGDFVSIATIKPT